MHKPGISEEAFARWLEAYGNASAEDDPDASATLFAEDAEYFESPFAPPLRGREAIREYWAQGARRFIDKKASFEILAVHGNRGIARWCSEFTGRDTGQRTNLDCIFIADFDGAGRCSLFREWWHSRTLPFPP